MTFLSLHRLLDPRQKAGRTEKDPLDRSFVAPIHLYIYTSLREGNQTKGALGVNSLCCLIELKTVPLRIPDGAAVSVEEMFPSLDTTWEKKPKTQKQPSVAINQFRNARVKT